MALNKKAELDVSTDKVTSNTRLGSDLESYMKKLQHLVKTSKHKNIKRKALDLIQKIDPRLNKKNSSDKRNILFVADKDYICHSCKTGIKIGEEMRNCQSCGNFYCFMCGLLFAEYDIEKEAGVCDSCYRDNKVGHNLKQENENEEEEEMDISSENVNADTCYMCQRNFENEEKIQCEACQNFFCGTCLTKKAELPFTQGEVNVCDTCYILCEGPGSGPGSLIDEDEEMPVFLVQQIVLEEEEAQAQARALTPQLEEARALTPVLEEARAPAVKRKVNIPAAPLPNRIPDENPPGPFANLPEQEQLQVAMALSLDETASFIPEQEEIDVALAISLSDVGIEPSEPEEPTDRAETDEEALLALALSQSQELQEQKLQESLAAVFGKEKNCRKCKVELNVQEIKNCKTCGSALCDKCIIKTFALPQFGIGRQAEVCQTCFDLLKIVLKVKPTREKKPAPQPLEGECCHKCRTRFNDQSEKERCEGCGNFFCQKCLNQLSTLPLFAIDKNVRVCEACYNFHNKEKKMLIAVKRFKILEDENKRLSEEKKRLSEARECKICMENEATVVFFSCRHLVACGECAPKFTHCPLCRKIIDSSVKVYTF